MCPARRPGEMFRPGLCPGVEQCDILTGLGVGCTDTVALEVVAARTGQPEVVALRRAAQRLWVKVVILQRHTDVRLRCMAVATAAAGVFTHPAPQINRD